MNLSQRTPADSPFAILYATRKPDDSYMPTTARKPKSRAKLLKKNRESHACTSNRTNSATASR
jgi:hypothetical protein